MKLRPYQEEAIAAVRQALNSGMKNPLVCLPTGSGKSPTLCHLVWDIAKRKPDYRFLITVHTQELIKQLADTYERVSGTKPGIYSASLRQKEHDHQVTIAQVQSFVRNDKRFNRYAILVIDECDRQPPEGNGQYRTLIADLKACNPDLRIVGFTATPYRTGSGLVYGNGAPFDDLVYDAGIKPLIKDGFLCSLIGKDGGAPDLTGIHVRKGDYVASELEDYMSNDKLIAAAVREILKYASGRKKTLIFASGVKHAHMISTALQTAGVTCPVITGNMPNAERVELIDRFKAGTLSFLANINVLSVGFDAPDIDMIVMLRPTKSPGLMYQQIGRGLRTAPGKENCLILDLAGNIREHGPIDELNSRIKRKRSAKSTGEALSKTCPKCQNICGLATKVCECGFEFIREDENLVKHANKAFSDAPLSAPMTWEPCHKVSYKAHRKNVDCVWAKYVCGIGIIVSDFLPLNSYKLRTLIIQSEDITKEKRLIVVNNTLTTTHGDEITFDNIAQWMYTLRMPNEILPKRNGEYLNVDGRRYSEHSRKETA